MGTLNVNFPAMRTAAEDVRTCHNALVSEKEDLEKFLTTVRQTWSGSAAGNWQKAQNDWGNACDEVNQILMHMYNALEVALGNYAQTERYLEQLWGG
jgi:WXG100 family type VII secretion target